MIIIKGNIMYKRKILAVAISTIFVANSGLAAEIYNKDGNKVNLTGQVSAIYTFRDDKTYAYDWNNDTVSHTNLGKNNNADTTFARLGFSGETQINSALTGYATFVHNFNAGKAGANQDDSTRLAYVGLSYDTLGSIDFGRNYGVVKTVRDFTDASDFDDLVGLGLTATSSKDVGMLDRASSLATYTNKDGFGFVEGLDFYLQYQAKNTQNDKLAQKNGDGVGVTATYEHMPTGLGFGATYARNDRVDAQKIDNNADNSEIWAIASKFESNIAGNEFYTAVSWAETHNLVAADNIYTNASCGLINSTGCQAINNVADKTKGFEAIVKYTLNLGNDTSFTPQVAYNQSRAYDLNVVDTDGAARINTKTRADLTKFVAIGAGYKFNKNIDTSMGYKINLVDKSSMYTQQAQVSTDDRLEMRITYSF